MIHYYCLQKRGESGIFKKYLKQSDNNTLFKKMFPDSLVGKESACNAGDPGLIPGSERSPGEGKRVPTPVFWPGECRRLYSPWGRKELDTTE